MIILVQSLQLLLRLFVFLLILRIVTEMVGSFSREFRPPRWFALIAEPVFRITDPPVKGLRRLIPPVRLGSVGLDVSVLVLFLLCMVAQMVLASLAVPAAMRMAPVA